ncbi:hypothetical protein SDC9_168495 [bioreactor metagenome]|uniref:Uncharacterized protein n=1 Tax=bioreactor metagenome TaxID=1076179 RepID=A0A645G4Q3_9ZZZZ
MNNSTDLYAANTPLCIVFTTFTVNILCSACAFSNSFLSATISNFNLDSFSVQSFSDTLVITADISSPTLYTSETS